MQGRDRKPKTQLRFELGGYMDEGMVIQLRRGRLLCSKTMGPYRVDTLQVLKPTEEQWRQFWQAVDRIGVWTWLPEYTLSGAPGGWQWSLSLAHEGRTVKCGGTNAYPGLRLDNDLAHSPWGEFGEALATLTEQQGLPPKTEAQVMRP